MELIALSQHDFPEEPLPQTQDTVPPEQSQSFLLDLYFWLQALVVALVVLILLFTFVGRIIGVDGSSMVPTLQDGEMLLLRSIGYTPQTGDVVVLTKSSFMEQPIVKRVIATEGQTVKIDYNTSTVYVDGVALDEYYLDPDEPMVNPSPNYISEIVVEEDSIFVMGDNRNRSDDSRSPNLASVDVDYVLGEAVLILFPFSNFALI